MVGLTIVPVIPFARPRTGRRRRERPATTTVASGGGAAGHEIGACREWHRDGQCRSRLPAHDERSSQRARPAGAHDHGSEGRRFYLRTAKNPRIEQMVEQMKAAQTKQIADSHQKLAKLGAWAG
jgi:hypothetical protein